MCVEKRILFEEFLSVSACLCFQMCWWKFVCHKFLGISTTKRILRCVCVCICVYECAHLVALYAFFSPHYWDDNDLITNFVKRIFFKWPKKKRKNKKPIYNWELLLCCEFQMLKHVQISPHRNRSDSISLRSSTSCASSLCGSPEPPGDSLRTPSRASSYCSLNETIPQVRQNINTYIRVRSTYIIII